MSRPCSSVPSTCDTAPTGASLSRIEPALPQVRDDATVGGSAHRGQPVQLYGEDDEEDDAGPVVGHRDAQHGDSARELVEPAALPECGEQAECDAGAERERRARAAGRRTATSPSTS